MMDDYAFAVFDGEKDTYSEWGLMLESVSIPLPSAQIRSIHVPGMTGALDLTEVLSGNVDYNNRMMTLVFSAAQSYDSWSILISDIANYLHGRKRKIVLDIDPGYYYYGRFAVDSNKTDEALCTIVITGTVEPYKYENAPQELTVPVSSEQTIILMGSAMPVVPTISSTDEMTVEFNDNEYDLEIGDNLIPEICLVEGSNTLFFTGDGTITITYLRGSF